ncbi:GNAT family N-acetyltransferase [Vibrio breoganii]|uniref:GNAT family N-acetyltransferase n=1 Tax=Vibrio breoganii TaxID=553239 RepID=UPI000C84BC17|nr:GNAT family protein [Vibrio breoganii]PML90430.1 GNAT family N-acetyltransferase [Vibrio breoganii]PMM87834.1 GNAT family N-acetyltransferase [Vibrio breoganii]PMP01027.1 GNAT family N-acetyltransferase [Vibrio breoganii]TKG29246.1 GNAT family N-acetyltransferase [Vibrio breoganii]
MALRAFVESDYPQLIDWINTPELNYLWGGPAYNYPLTSMQIHKHCSQESVLPFIFEYQSEPIGFVELYKVSTNECRICRVLIADKFRGQGLAQQMMQLIISKAFADYQANRLTLNVFAHNTSALLCYTKLGFNLVSTEMGTREFKGKLWELFKMEKRRHDHV